MNHRTLRGVLLVATAGLVLAACGGGGNDAPAYSYETAATPPDSAGVNISSFLGFIADLAGSPLENREPFDLSAYVLPTDDADALPPVATAIDQ